MQQAFEKTDRHLLSAAHGCTDNHSVHHERVTEQERGEAKMAEPTVKEDKKFYTLTEVQSILRISRTSAYNLVKKEGFPKMRVCGKYLIPVTEFDKWCAEQTTMEGEEQ